MAFASDPCCRYFPESILERPLRSKRHLPRCFLHQMLITLVVASGRHDGGMSHRLPHGFDVGAGLKEPRRKGSAKIMRREGRNRRFVCPGAQQLMDGASRNRPAGLDVVALLPPPLPSAWHTLALAQHPDDPPLRFVNAEPRNSSVEGRVDRRPWPASAPQRCCAPSCSRPRELCCRRQTGPGNTTLPALRTS